MQQLDRPWPFRLVSAFIGVVLFLQVVAVLFETERHAWPFMNYPMYATSIAEGDRVDVDHRVVAELDDGSEVDITWDSLGLDPGVGLRFWLFRIWIVNGLLQLESPRRAWQEMATDEQSRLASWSARHRQTLENTVALITERYRAEHGRRIVRLRVEDTGAIITRHGLQREAPVTVRTIEVAEVIGRTQS
jgi:hypothetical protein